MATSAHYADANGLRTYYEEQGQGPPLLLLHGGFGNANNFAGMREALAAEYRLIIPERRGHGHTQDLPGEISYEAMADDTLALMDAIGLERAHLAGWSDGAMVGLLVALKAPARVDKLVFLSQYINSDGKRDTGAGGGLDWTVETVPPAIKRAYEKRAPEGPEHFPVVFAKIMRMMREEPELPIEELTKVQSPTLIAAADVDILTLEHALEQFRMIPDAQLAILPGVSHGFPMERPELVARLILDFLSDEKPPRLF